MALIEQQGNPSKEIVMEDLRSPEEIANDAAVALVVQDAETAASWIASQQWNDRWDEIDILYDSPRGFKVWEQTTVMQPNVSRFIVAQHVNSLHPALKEGIFYEDPPFMIKQREGTDADAVRARRAVLSYQLTNMCFENEVDSGLFQQILHGTGIWKWGMREVEKPDYSYTRDQQPLQQTGSLGQTITLHSDESDIFNEKVNMKRVMEPFFENWEIRNVLVDPGLRCPDIRKAKYVIFKSYVTFDDLVEMRKDPQYTNIPGEEVLRSLFTTPKEQPAIAPGMLDNGNGSPSLAGQGEPPNVKTTEDPTQQGLLLLERWDNNKVITVLNNKIAILNKANPYRVIPAYSCNWYNRIRAFWGLGVGRIVSQDQRLNQGLINGGLALLQLLLDPPYAVADDANAPTQNMRFRKGGFIKLKLGKSGNIRDVMAPLEMPRLPVTELFAFLSNTEQAAEQADGANALLMQGSTSGGGKTSLTRTRGGAADFGAAVAQRLQGPLDHFINQVFKPWLYQLDELNRRFLPMQQVRDICGDELGKDYELDDARFLNAKVEFDVLAGTQMAAKKIMAQSLPLLTQIFEQPQIVQFMADTTGEYIDLKEVLLTWLEAVGWPNRKSLFKKMTPAMHQRQQGRNPAVAKAQTEGLMENQKFAHAKDLLRQKGEQNIAEKAVQSAFDKASAEVDRQVVEKAATPLAVTGEPGGSFEE